MKLSIASHTLHYSMKGEGPCVLLLHGFMETLHIWDDLAKELSKKYKVVSVDIPGHGLSDDLKDAISIDQMASLIHAFVNQLGVEKPIIIGHSMGGYIGLAYADLFSQELHSLCLFHSMAAADTNEAKVNRDRKINLMSRHPNALIEESIQNLFWKDRKDRFKEEITHLSNQAKERKPSGYIQALLAMKRRPDRIHVLKSGIPILYLAGKHDPIIAIEKSVEEAKKIKKGSIAILNNSGHMGFIEEKEASMDLINKFLLQEFKHH